MPRKFAVMPDGTRILVRAEYTAASFSVPAAELDRLAKTRGRYGSLDLLEERDSELGMYRRIRDFERDGKQWTLLLNPAEYAIEVELTRGAMGELRCLPPLEAYALARELDRSDTRFPTAVEESFELAVALGRPGPAID